jgi:nucleotide-binding universal stress UspA family protein
MDRAVDLAALWAAQLVVLNVVETREGISTQGDKPHPAWRDQADAQELAQARVARDLREDLKGLDVRVLEGQPADCIDAVAKAEHSDLIVTGIARDETLGRQWLGSTVERLSRATSIPLLVVKCRLRPYGEILIATDFSDGSQEALGKVAALFPSARLTLLHGWHVPFPGFQDNPGFRRTFRAELGEKAAAFVAAARLSATQQQSLQLFVEEGDPETLVGTYMRDRGVDLVVVGTHDRAPLFDDRLGGTARRILKSAPGDVLLVRVASAVR